MTEDGMAVKRAAQFGTRRGLRTEVARGGRFWRGRTLFRLVAGLKAFGLVASERNIDGSRAMNGVEALRNINVDQVQEIRHLNSRDATMQYGTDHGAGAIMVTTKH